MFELLQMWADRADGLPALQRRWRGLSAHEPLPDELLPLDVVPESVVVDPLLAEAVVAVGSVVEDVPVPVVVLPVLALDALPVLALDVLPVAPDGSPVVGVGAVVPVVGVELAEEPSPPALGGVGPVSPVVGLTVGVGPVVDHEGGTVGVGLEVDLAPPSALPVPVVAAGFPPAPAVPADPEVELKPVLCSAW